MAEHPGAGHPGPAESPCVLVYMTAGDLAEGRRIAAALVAEHLAACVNLLPEMLSVYRWQGAVEEAGEVVMIAKTTGDRLEALTDRVRALHSYDCPCVVAMPLIGGNPAFLDWIGETCRAGGESPGARPD